MYKHPSYPLRVFPSTRARRRFQAQDRLDYVSTGKTADPDFLIHVMQQLRFANEADVIQYIEQHYFGDPSDVIDAYRSNFGMVDNKYNTRVMDFYPPMQDHQLRQEILRMVCWLKWFLRLQGEKDFDVEGYSSLGGMQSGTSPRISVHANAVGFKNYILDYSGHGGFRKSKIKILNDTLMIGDSTVVYQNGKLLNAVIIGHGQYERWRDESIEIDRDFVKT